MKRFLFVVFILTIQVVHPQTITQKIDRAFEQFEADPQLKHAIASLYVIDGKTGQVLFAKNERIGLAPASTQKIVTSATALELLGKEFRYKTEFGYRGDVNKNGEVDGSLFVTGSGDPTLGSKRYFRTQPSEVERGLIDKLRALHISSFTGPIISLRDAIDRQSIPDGWIWQDIGNYYGAGPASLNWNENQFDLVFKPGAAVGDTARILKTDPSPGVPIINDVRAGPPNSGDNGYIYFEPGAEQLYATGTVPCCVESFTISGAVPSPERFALTSLAAILQRNNISGNGQALHTTNEPDYRSRPRAFYTHYSPALDSIVYWLNRKSINFYAEALLKTLGTEKRGFGSLENGISVIKEFWKNNNIETAELNLHDGSGLSPLNRVTTHAQVEVLRFAKSRSWFNYFYNSLPEYNNTKMKSGTISDVKAFCGYQTSAGGQEFIFSFIVNNYDGMSALLVNKMYKVLDTLK